VPDAASGVPKPLRPWRVIVWDGTTLGNWQSEIDCDVVINLTGRSVNCRYTATNREAILQSRVWLQASTATIYAHRYDRPNDEHSGILGGTNRAHHSPGDTALTSQVRGSARSKKPLPMELEKLRFGQR
jgi:NAD dependent epimerase/dehydratase family enzyme